MNSVILILAEPVLLLFCTTLSREKTNTRMELKYSQTPPEETEPLFAMNVQEWAMYFNLETPVEY